MEGATLSWVRSFFTTGIHAQMRLPLISIRYMCGHIDTHKLYHRPQYNYSNILFLRRAVPMHTREVAIAS